LRQRKEENTKFLYDGSMPAPITKNWTVQQTLKVYPDTLSVFVQLKTDCVGCWMERFCTLEEVGNAYGIAPETMIDSLHKLTTLSYPKE
jgi:hybrid cluster-associated redox disulfide protein